LIVARVKRGIDQVPCWSAFGVNLICGKIREGYWCAVNGYKRHLATPKLQKKRSLCSKNPYLVVSFGWRHCAGTGNRSQATALQFNVQDVVDVKPAAVIVKPGKDFCGWLP
jgi:hypothetical protein